MVRIVLPLASSDWPVQACFTWDHVECSIQTGWAIWIQWFMHSWTLQPAAISKRYHRMFCHTLRGIAKNLWAPLVSKQIGHTQTSANLKGFRMLSPIHLRANESRPLLRPGKSRRRQEQEESDEGRQNDRLWTWRLHERKCIVCFPSSFLVLPCVLMLLHVASILSQVWPSRAVDAEY